MPLFQNSVLNKYLKEQDKEAVQTAFDKYRSYFHNPDIQRNIDQMVYELYGLTEEEIRIVEESTNIKNGQTKIQVV